MLSFYLLCLFKLSLLLPSFLSLFYPLLVSIPPSSLPPSSPISIDYKVDRDQVRRVEFTQGGSKYLILLIVTQLLILLIVTTSNKNFYSFYSIIH